MSQLRAGPGLVALTLLAACAVPTEAPIFDTTWELPGKNTSISVNTLLPSGVQVASDNSAFQVTVNPSSTTISRSLGQDCAACTGLNGVTAPKPAFTGGGSANVTLPSTVTSATLVRDTITVSINNGFNFDPIRPSGSARGYLLLTVRNGSTVIGRDSIDGANTALAAGATLTRKIPLSGTINGANGMQVATTLNSPLGDPVTIDVNRSISVTGSVGNFFVSAAQVSVANQNISSAPSELDLSGIDESLSKRANGGALLLTVNNPFNVTGNLTVKFNGGAMPVQKPIALAGGTTTPKIVFTKTELMALLGNNITITFAGNVNGSTVTVAPGQVVAVASRLQVNLTVGGK